MCEVVRSGGTENTDLPCRPEEALIGVFRSNILISYGLVSSFGYDVILDASGVVVGISVQSYGCVTHIGEACKFANCAAIGLLNV